MYIALFVCSIGVLCLETHPDFRVPGRRPTSCEAIRNNATNETRNARRFPASILQGDNPKTHRYITTAPHPILGGLDRVCTCIFTVELVLRFVAWPDKIRFFARFLNVVDTLAVLPMSAILITVWIDCVFRPVRILKVVEHSR
ncbi:hypothetical protein LSH36_14g05029 [Paralvinella palmiformis]|uniref:Ion transport domain-containing protein n=1 Tax=Paralvinella palmiformis TaxID=53620 RepID=A0AAD9KCH9_9ANNE|nr:hypothetical protein LSH36_14g05029 [Paralvinella palmiformis]